MKTFFLIIIYLIISLPVKAMKIGYGSSTAVVTAKIQEGFLMGFELGFKKVLGERESDTSLLINQKNSSSQLAAKDSAYELIKKDVVALFGFPGSHDAILAGRIARDNKILAIFPGCNHSDLANLGPFVHTTGHSMQEEVSAIMSFATKKFKGKKGLVVVNPTAAPSLNQEAIFIDKAIKYNEVKLNLVRLNKQLLLDDSEIKKIKKNFYAFIVLTAYPEALVALTEQFLSNDVDLPTLAGSAWGTVDSDVMRRFIAGKKNNFYILSSWLRGAKASLAFETAFKKVYGRDPTPDNAFGYDLGVVAGSLIKKVKGRPTKELIAKTLLDVGCFKGLSIGSLCFNPNGGHVNRPIYFLKYTKQGFVLENIRRVKD